MPRRSIGFPLTVGIVLTLIAVSLAVGWQILVVADLEPVTRGLTTVQWLLIGLGSLFFILIIVGLVLLCAWVVREMRVNQRQRAFLDAVTHEMKTPLASMRLFLETLRRHDVDPERRRDFLERMGEDVERLEHTVSQVLAAARAEGTARRVRGEPVDLTAVLSESIVAIRERHGLAEEAIRLERESAVGAAYDAFGSERYVLAFDNKRVRDIAGAAPYEFLIILANDRKYGGGGIFNLYATGAVDNAFVDYLVVHEFGHHFAGLADEYYTSEVAYEIDPDAPEPMSLTQRQPKEVTPHPYVRDPQ